MHVSYRRPVELFGGGGPRTARYQFRAHRPMFRRSTLYFTSMPASESDPTSVFAIRIGPRFSLSEQVGGSPLGSTLGAPLAKDKTRQDKTWLIFGGGGGRSSSRPAFQSSIKT